MINYRQHLDRPMSVVLVFFGGGGQLLKNTLKACNIVDTELSAKQICLCL